MSRSAVYGGDGESFTIFGGAPCSRVACRSVRPPDPYDGRGGDGVRTGGSIYEEAGGAVGLGAAVSVFYARMLADPELAGYFVGVDFERLRAHQREFLAVAFGGPELYSGRPLEQAHAGLGITDEHFDRTVDHLAGTLADLGLAPAAVAVVRARVGDLRSSIVAPGR